MDVVHLFTRSQALLTRNELVWVWTTTVLSLLVAGGYVGIAVLWYFQSRLARRESAKALAHLRNVFLVCAISGFAFWTIEMPWVVWRIYNVLLFAIACYTWSFVLRAKGWSLIDELEQAAKRYREIAELLPHIVWTAAETGRIDYSNRRWTEYSQAQTWLDAVHPADQQDVRRWWEEALTARRAAGREVRLEGRQGYRTFSVKATPIENGPAVKWLGACADIEDQKRLAAEKELQAKQKSFFLNALSHDLRAPLNSVVLNAHLLKMTAGEPPDLESVNVIIENAVAAGELLSKLLEYERAGHEQSAAEIVSIATMLQQIRRRFAPLAQQKGLYLRVVEGEDVQCKTDRNKLERIISNLVDNSMKHTNTGGIELSSNAIGERTAVRISDTGSGIPAEDAPYLFEEFYQVNNHERDRNKGFGLGLAICRSLARQLGGDVRLVRTGREGSCFEVLIEGHCSDRRGRLERQEGDQTNPSAPGLCSV